MRQEFTVRQTQVRCVNNAHYKTSRSKISHFRLQKSEKRPVKSWRDGYTAPQTHTLASKIWECISHWLILNIIQSPRVKCSHIYKWFTRIVKSCILNLKTKHSCLNLTMSPTPSDGVLSAVFVTKTQKQPGRILVSVALYHGSIETGDACVCCPSPATGQTLASSRHHLLILTSTQCFLWFTATASVKPGLKYTLKTSLYT